MISLVILATRSGERAASSPGKGRCAGRFQEENDQVLMRNKVNQKKQQVSGGH